ncbi:hypothetical protein [Flavobacterium johnsoniae]|uniref:Uncharacterized protein n=1 Tax=Flavobacterium johnsoniae TaxID=986 RepID=A0A1J7BPJ3_FLAJO|nr:hypothetical protein [Flavobacterium johnsoniae]OIV40615.1 hypothetical protein BKM63_17265 [Flavobacterium johnsoniae]
MDTKKSDEAASDNFETIAPEKDNPVKKEFEIGELGNDELKEDERARNVSRYGAPAIINLPSENFSAFRFDKCKTTDSLLLPHN